MNTGYKKIIAAILAFVTALSVTACNSITNSSESLAQNTSESTAVASTVSPIKLTNKMTETERSRVDRHALTLLDDPEAPEKDTTEEHKVSVVFHTFSTEELLENLESSRDKLTDSEYAEAMDYISNSESYSYPSIILVDGYIVPDHVPASDPSYDCGRITFTICTADENGKISETEYDFGSFEEYIDWIRKTKAEEGFSEAETEQGIILIKAANEALLTGNYETLPEGSVDASDQSLYFWNAGENADHRADWEYDRDAVSAIKDSIDEINIYDEELDREFVVHVTLPPDYDKNRSYPVFFLTDGIWRFGDHPKLRKIMENEEAAPVILVSLYYNYKVSDPDGNMRYFDLVVNRDKLLDFVTDNLMPYLGENYNIDCSKSTLYGHSDGGVFTHNALFKSDLYDNQPFGNYIIGSPALWGLYNYNDDSGISSDDVLNDYGYFDRNEKLDKSVFLCAGALEDPDYKDSYNGHDTTLEGVAKLKERLEAHGADMTCKLYDSHHYQFIPEMLTEFLKEKYPV